ncbi:MAG TPA: ATP-binding protein [Holophaga sp.]|nr:ATP-binding protein [Holophaga sp.]
MVIFLLVMAPIFVCFGVGVLANYQTDKREAESKSLKAVLALTREYSAEVEGLHALLQVLSTHPAIREGRKAECLAILHRVHVSTPYVDNLGLAAPTGQVIASSIQGNYTVEDRKYFLDALRTRRFSVGEYVVGRATGHPTIHFSLPVLDGEGNVESVLFASYNLDRFESIISHQNLPQGAVLNLTDHDGRVIYRHPRHGVVKPGLRDQPHLRAQVDGAAEEGVFRAVGLDGVKRLFGFRRLRLRPEDAPYLYARVTIPEPIAFAEANRFAGWALLSCAAAAGVAGLLLHLLAQRHLVRPIRALSRVAREAGSGGFSVRSGLEDREDEVGQVGRAFDRMVASLEAREAERDRLTEQLHQAQKMESLGRLAGGIAHDFNNLLTPIMIYSQLLSESHDTESKVGTKARQILAASTKAKTLIAKLMGLSRKQVLHLETVDLNRTIESFIDIIRRTIRENIDIVVEIPGRPLLVRADPTQIDQVLMNLVINAGDAIQGRGRIAIRAWAEPAEGCARIAVEDTGCGMDAETRRRIFEPFFTTKPKGEGTGLGLATVLGIIQQHGGEIDVASVPGEGSRFTLSLPLHTGAAAADPAPERAIRLPAVARGQMALLAEDNDLVRATAAELLRRLGFQVLEAPEPAEALALAKGHHVDLLLSDVIMPGMNGPELHRRLRETQPWTRAIFMSGHTDNIVLEHGQLPPGTAFLQKPFTREVFNECVTRVLAAAEEPAG